MTQATNYATYAATLRALYAAETDLCQQLPAFIAHLYYLGEDSQYIQRLKEHLSDSRWQKQLLKACLGLIGEESPVESASGPTFAFINDFETLLAQKRMEVESYADLIAVLDRDSPPEIRTACEEILEQEKEMAAWLESVQALEDVPVREASISSRVARDSRFMATAAF